MIQPMPVNPRCRGREIIQGGGSGRLFRYIGLMSMKCFVIAAGLIVLAGYAILPDWGISLYAGEHDYIRSGGLSWDREAFFLDWGKAREQCRKKGMRLPTRDELEMAYKNGPDALRRPGTAFWSGDPYRRGDTRGYVWYVYMTTGRPDVTSSGSSAHGRCVKP